MRKASFGIVGYSIFTAQVAIFATGKYGSYDKAKWERIVAVSAGYETVQAMDADGKVMWTGHYLDYRDYPD